LSNSTPEEQVRQRAGERWQALVGGDFNRAYSYNTADFRALVTPAVYRGRTGSAVTWVGSEVVNVKCPEPTKCTALVRIDFTSLKGGQSGNKMNIHTDETWLLENGQWWIFESIKGN
jgi:hypothetical protein